MIEHKDLVLARFDKVSDLKIRKIQTDLWASGSIDKQDLPPHLLLAAYESGALAEILHRTASFAARQERIQIHLPSFGFSPLAAKTALLYAAPAYSEKLFDFYYAFHESLGEHCRKPDRLYSEEADLSVLHTRIGTLKLEQMPEVLLKLALHPIGLVRIEALEVYTYPQRLSQSYPLANLSFKLASPADLAQIMQIDDLKRTKQISQAILAGQCHLVKKDGRIVGFGLLNNSFFANDFVELLVIAAEYRRQGIGAALLEYLAGQSTRKKLFISTNQSNLAMRSLLKKAGFYFCGQIDGLDAADPELFFLKEKL